MSAYSNTNVEEGMMIRVEYNSVYTPEDELATLEADVVNHQAWGGTADEVQHHELLLQRDGEPDRRLDYFTDDGVPCHIQVQGRNGARWHQLNVVSDDQASVQPIQDQEEQEMPAELAEQAQELLESRLMGNAQNPDVQQVRRANGQPGPSLEGLEGPLLGDGLAVYMLTEEGEEIVLGELELLDDEGVQEEISELEEQTYLSEREAQVLTLKRYGLSHGAIGQQLDVARSSVDEYSRRINQKAEKAKRTVAAVEGL